MGMGLFVTLYTFKKRVNSTLRPFPLDDDPTKYYRCELKDGCSITAPVLRLSDNDPLLTRFNYCHIPEFNRYYFISDWTYERGMWVCSCTVDILASNRDAIIDNRFYILRSQHNYDPALFDNMSTARIANIKRVEELDPIWSKTLPEGRYVLGIVGKSASMGATTYYVLDQWQFNALTNFMFSTVDWSGIDITDMSESIQKTVLSPIEYIVSCTWYPFIPPTGGDTTIRFGYWDSGINAKLLSSSPRYFVWDYTPVPQHPQYEELGRWTMLPPYTKLSLTVPPFGEFALDTSRLASLTSMVSYGIAVDCISGDATLELGYSDMESWDEATGGMRQLVASGRVGVPIALAQSHTDLIGVGSSIVGAGVAAITGNYAGAAANIASAWLNSYPNTTTKLTGGGFGALMNDVELRCIFYEICTPDASEIGRPSLRNDKPSPGFNLVARGDMALDVTDVEQHQLKALLEGGFFVE